MRCAGIPAYDVQRANFHKNWKWWIYNIFLHFYVYLILNFWVFFCGKLTKPCRHARTFQLVKRPPVATTVPSGTQRHHWGIGIPEYTFVYSIQARAIPPPSWGSALPGHYRQSIESPMGVPTFNSTEKALTFTIYENTVKKGVLFDES